MKENGDLNKKYKGEPELAFKPWIHEDERKLL